MCYNIKNKLKAAALREKYKAMADEALDKINYYHVSGFDHPQLPVLAQGHKNEFQLYYWGLIPSWCPDEAKARELSNVALNAKSETIFEKPMFRDAIIRKRCILPVTGFYEWREENKIKYPYFIYPKTDELFTMGCISDTWADRQTGEVLNTFSIVTTEANSVMALIHNKKKRMPLLLDDAGWEKWLDNSALNDEIKSLMTPAPDEWLGYHTISKTISRKNMDTNYAGIEDEVKYPELENRLF
ncbi:MAG TPA: SOS response-associated peptidase [Bacteroidia bacterium]|jgi:putative SOS response-associated peptidase YedK|nr:SOS response-associated peptidase [Bacteroidia bacterium]